MIRKTNRQRLPFLTLRFYTFLQDVKYWNEINIRQEEQTVNRLPIKGNTFLEEEGMHKGEYIE